MILLTVQEIDAVRSRTRMVTCPVVQLLALMVQTALKTVEGPQLHFIDEVVTL